MMGGGGGPTPPIPPFARNQVATSKLHEEHELVWDDGVAPELTIDFDAQHISSAEGLAWWLGGIFFFVGFYQLIAWTDPEGKNPAVNREVCIIANSGQAIVNVPATAAVEKEE
jgi:hypothetical protein